VLGVSQFTVNKSLDLKKSKPAAKYDVLVIDPPWPMQKIDRNSRIVSETLIVKFHHGEIFLGAKILHQGLRFTA
jgi:hypothetical protein